MRRALPICVALSAALPLILAGCGKPEAKPTGTPQAQPPIEQYYASRAEVISLPDETTELVLKHEAISEFINMKGNQTGMQAMQMPFPLAEGVSLEGFKVGDKVEFEFTVDWNPSYYITSISKLPNDTEMDYSFKEPPTVYETGP